ncbi:MAG: winged helix-turn-helix transcriptional regulator [Campylobacteraceae bacterium]
MADYTEKQECCNSQICSLDVAAAVVSGKYKSVIIYKLLSGKKRFNELNKLIIPITHRTLTLQLRELESDGIVKRTVYAEVPPRVEYELTTLGESMRPIIDAMKVWGEIYKNREITEQ